MSERNWVKKIKLTITMSERNWVKKIKKINEKDIIEEN